MNKTCKLPNCYKKLCKTYVKKIEVTLAWPHTKFSMVPDFKWSRVCLGRGILCASVALDLKCRVYVSKPEALLLSLVTLFLTSLFRNRNRRRLKTAGITNSLRSEKVKPLSVVHRVSPR